MGKLWETIFSLWTDFLTDRQLGRQYLRAGQRFAEVIKWDYSVVGDGVAEVLRRFASWARLEKAVSYRSFGTKPPVWFLHLDWRAMEDPRRFLGPPNGLRYADELAKLWALEKSPEATIHSIDLQMWRDPVWEKVHTVEKSS